MRAFLLSVLPLLAAATCLLPSATAYESCYFTFGGSNQPDRSVVCYDRTDGEGFVLVAYRTCLYAETSPTGALEVACYTTGPATPDGFCALTVEPLGGGAPTYGVGCERYGLTCVLTERLGTTEYRYACT